MLKQLFAKSIKTFKKRKGVSNVGILCLLCISAVASIIVVSRWNIIRIPVPHIGQVLGVPIISDISFLQEKQRVSAKENPGVCFEDVLLPYDMQEICYLSQNCNEEWIGRLTVSDELKKDYFLCAAEDSYWEKKTEAMRSNHKFVIWLVGENDYYELQLVVSGMPVLAIEESRQELQEKVPYEVDPDAYVYDPDILCYGTLRLFGSEMDSERYEIVQTNVRYYLKGAMTKRLDKKSYSLKLLDYNEGEVKTSLLGMGESESWKLNALATDENRIREKTAAQIWEQFDSANIEVEQPGPKEEYVEVVVNNQYVGIYCLLKPVDEHALNLDSNDILYKMVSSDLTSDESIQTAIDNGWKVQIPIRIRYPKKIENYHLAWYPIRDWLNIFYNNETVDYKRIENKAQITNLEDATMFLMTCTASDNSFKNSYYAANVSSPGEYMMTWCPWDLDYTFGNMCDGEMKDVSTFNNDYKVVYQNNEFEKLMSTDGSEIGEEFLMRWKEYREGFLSTDNIVGLLKKNRNYLIETGAMEREKKRWPEYGISEDIDYLLEYQEKRMEWLDEYFEAWTSQ